MSKKKQKEGFEPDLMDKGWQKIPGAEKPVGAPGFSGNLPHSSKKVSLGPNTKR